MALPGFLFGGTTGETAESLKRKREMIEALQNEITGRTPKTAAEGWAAVMRGAATGIGRYQADKSEGKMTDAAKSLFYSKITGQPAPSAADTGFGPGYGSLDPSAGATPSPQTASAAPADMGDNSIYNAFISTVKDGGISNPYGLAAVAATGKAESGFDAANVNRAWSDPSVSGKPGMAGGIMSWRADRLDNLKKFAASNGEDPSQITPQTQAKFFLQEDPQLVARLNEAKSPQEAQQMMNNAWRFAGYDKPGGEAARRMSLASSFAPTFQGNGAPTQQAPAEVASLDPAAGMDSPTAAINAVAPGSGTVAPANTPPAFDAGRFADPIKLSEMPASQADMASNLRAQANAFVPQPQQGGNPASQMGVPFTGQPLNDEQRAAAQAKLQPVMDQAGVPFQSVAAPQAAGLAPAQQAIQTQQQPAPQQVAQAQPQRVQQPRQRQAPTMDNELYGLAANPFLPPEMRAQVNARIAQQEQAVRQYEQFEGQRQLLDYKREMDASDPNSQADLAYKRAQTEALQRKSTDAEPDEWGLTPVWGTDKAGKTVLGQVSKSNKFRPLDTGDFTPTPGINNIDMGTATRTVNNRTGATIMETPKNLAEAESQKELGTATGKAIASAPQDALAGQNAKDLIESLKTDPNRQWGTGVSSLGNWLPASPGKDYQNKVDQAKSGAFLTAIQQMRGLGSLSNAEGGAATAAVTRMDTATSEGAFMSALDDYEKIIDQGIETAKRRLPGGQPQPQTGGRPELDSARRAIASGAPREAVIQRLRANNIDPEGL